jgi:antitoxin component HigA of HigAB toxin-antitoxin module
LRGPRLDPAFVRQEISQLLANNPELGEDEVLRADMIEGSTGAHEFISEMLRRIAAATIVIDGIGLYKADLNERLARMQRREEALRGLILKLLQHADLRKVELAEATVFQRAGSRKVIITNELMIPEGFVRIKREPDKLAIRAELQRGGDVPGCLLSNAEPSLTIKTR